MDYNKIYITENIIDQSMYLIYTFDHIGSLYTIENDVYFDIRRKYMLVYILNEKQKSNLEW